MEVERVARDFATSGIECVVLKGASLALSAYKTPAERFMGDIDLLVRLDQVDAALEQLLSMGYTNPWSPEAVRGYRTFHYHLPLARPDGHIVELATGASLNTTGTGTLRTNTLTGFGNTIDLDCSLYIGTDVGGTGGSHTVGAGQSLDVEDYCYIGFDAAGTLTISGGGDVTNGGYAYIGRYASADGSSASVSGTGSTWTSGHTLYVGVSGDATMRSGCSRARKS